MSLLGLSTAPAGDDDVSALPARAPVLVQLLLRPDALFTGERVYLTKRATVVIILTLGLSVAFDNTDRLRSLFDQGGAFAVAGLTIGGLVGGIVHWVIFSGLFRTRIWLCGARGLDQDRAQAIFGITSLVPAVVVVASSLMDLLPGRDPSEDWFAAVVVAVYGWSAFAGYRAVCAAFPVSRGKARFWFLVVPAIVFAVLSVREAGLF